MRAERPRPGRLAAVLLILLLASAPVAAAVHVTTVTGNEPSVAATDRNLISLHSGETLPGVLSLSIDRTRGSVEGTFTMSIAAGADDRSLVGTLEGQITGGSVSVLSSGLLSAIDLTLTVTSGTGRFDGASGSGTVKTSSGEGNVMNGTLSLSF